MCVHSVLVYACGAYFQHIIVANFKGKHFTNFVVLILLVLVKVFSTKYWGQGMTCALLGWIIQRKFSPQNFYFPTIVFSLKSCVHKICDVTKINYNYIFNVGYVGKRLEKGTIPGTLTDHQLLKILSCSQYQLSSYSIDRGSGRTQELVRLEGEQITVCKVHVHMCAKFLTTPPHQRWHLRVIAYLIRIYLTYRVGVAKRILRENKLSLSGRCG